MARLGSLVRGADFLLIPSRTGGSCHDAQSVEFAESAITLAESLSFSRAARTRHISQPTLTKHIIALEEWVGVRLFDRDRQSVAMTDPGRAFIEEARLTVIHFERAIQAARGASHGHEVTLNIGRSPYTDPFLISTLLAVRLPLYPGLKVELLSQFTSDLVHDLLAGSMDLAITTEPPLSQSLAATEVARTPFFIAMAKTDDAALRQELRIADLNRREWVLFERRIHPSLYDTIHLVAKENGVTPSQTHHIMTAEEAFPFLTQGRSLAFLTKAGALRIARGPVTIRPLIEDALVLKTYIAARADNKSKLASEFMRAYVRKLSQVNGTRQLQLSIAG